MSGPLKYPRKIRWGDTDTAQIAYTVRFFDYSMEAIDEWFLQILGNDWFDLTRQGIGSPFVNINMDIKMPLTPRDDLVVNVYVERLGNASLTFRTLGEVTGKGQSFNGNFTCCFIDTETKKSQRISSEMRKKIETFITEGGGYQEN